MNWVGWSFLKKYRSGTEYLSYSKYHLVRDSYDRTTLCGVDVPRDLGYGGPHWHVSCKKCARIAHKLGLYPR